MYDADIKESIMYLAEFSDIYNEFKVEDAPYGLSGEAAPWDTATGERLSDGGADQKWLPLTVDDFEKMGMFKEK